MVRRELLFSVTKDDFRIDTFRAGGKGGQHQNKTDSGDRLTHIESGAVGESRSERSQHANRKKAFRRCIDSEKFKLWHKRKTAELMLNRTDIEAKVNKTMSSQNIRIESFDGDKWEEEDDRHGIGKSSR